MKDTAGSREGASVQPDVQAKLGDKLKEVYSDVLNAPVPDRFTELLDQLARKGTGSNGASNGDGRRHDGNEEASLTRDGAATSSPEDRG